MFLECLKFIYFIYISLIIFLLNFKVKMEYVPLHVAFPPPNICHHTDSGASSQDVSMIAEPISLQAMCINIICFTHKKMKVLLFKSFISHLIFMLKF